MERHTPVDRKRDAGGRPGVARGASPKALRDSASYRGRFAAVSLGNLFSRRCAAVANEERERLARRADQPAVR
jgi:hypothetical protein